MSLTTIKSTKQWFSSNNLKICNICIQISGREGKCDVHKPCSESKKKICKVSLHFSGREGEPECYDEMRSKRERKREAEAGNHPAGNPRLDPNPSSKIKHKNPKIKPEEPKTQK